jgi:NAD(P)-dependent dehydrogenase (short-subunit alcohol dehydrogenase family)
MAHEDKGAVVITGAAGDLGSRLCDVYAAEGYTVFGADIEPVPRRERVIPMRVDVTDRAAVVALAERAADESRGLKIWINCAGIFVTTDLLDADEPNWHLTIAVNLTGTFHGCAAALEIMRTSGGGHIVNLGSLSGQIGGLGVHPAYGASKAGVHALTKSYALEGAKHAVYVNAVAPGLMEAQMVEQFADPQKERLLKQLPFRRFGRVEEIVAAVKFLTSPGASYVTGITLPVNGGGFLG